MMRPTRLALRSRASVSVSGNSGTPTVLAPTDVMTVLATGEPDLLSAEPATLLRFRESGRHAGNGEDPASGREQRAVGRLGSSGVKDDDLVRYRREIDVIAGARRFRIAG